MSILYINGVIPNIYLTVCILTMMGHSRNIVWARNNYALLICLKVWLKYAKRPLFNLAWITKRVERLVFNSSDISAYIIKCRSAIWYDNSNMQMLDFMGSDATLSKLKVLIWNLCFNSVLCYNFANQLPFRNTRVMVRKFIHYKRPTF